MLAALILISSVLFPVAKAQTVLIRGAKISRLEYEAALHADPSNISPVSAYLNQHPTTDHQDELLKLFGQSQKAYLAGSMREAISDFQKTLALQTADDWNESERRIFVECDLRLAQLQPNQADLWLKRSWDLGRDVAIDKSLYPPPLLARRNQIAKQLKYKKITRDNFESDWNAVLINGQICESHSCQSLPVTGDPVRITYLSNRWKAVSYVTDAKSMFTRPPSERPIGAQEYASAKIFTGVAKIPLENLKPQDVPDAFPPMVVKTKRSSFYKSKWFWIGVGGALVAFAVIHNAQHHASPEPTTTYQY